jgi:hypothetical protein
MSRILLVLLVAFTPTLVLALEVEVTENLANLNIKTVPTNAEITLNSETIGMAPIRDLILPSGEYTICALLSGWEPIERNVVLEAGTTTDVRFHLAKDVKGWFRARDAYIGFGLFWVVLGLSVAFWLGTADMG